MSKRQTLFIGFMTFALFLGAGNIIFPPMLGHGSGEAFIPALGGFLLTSVGMPALTLIAIAWIGGSDAITDQLPRWVHLLFWSALLLTIGPFFNMPRTFTVAYEFTGRPFFGDDGLLMATLMFAALTLYFALSPQKLMDRVGKLLTPIILLLIGFILVSVMTNPHGNPEGMAEKYQGFAFAAGLSDGYMTMDVLGAIGFGWLIINVLNQHRKPDTSLSREMGKVVIVYSTVMCGVYIAMAWIGAHFADDVSNGGELLSRYMSFIYGDIGMMCLGIIMALACLTTAVGLTCASASFFNDNFFASAQHPATNYKVLAISIVSLSTLIANVGLDTLIKVTLPLVVMLHPVTITVIGLAVYFYKRKMNLKVWGWTLCVAMLGGSIDALKILDKMPLSLSQYFTDYLPLYNYNASWVVPSVLSFMLATLLTRQRASAIPSPRSLAEH
ncbi:branched-chain amino acid transport system II carrier protein [Shewanella eurypsychrophilus]|uniref:Branched-chain amino acid transport system carrier protein n=1 Tax=Shewanella eurypsychrophilus TaxID=2593656 RepID=A0ABX6V369_9GAMM|nr:MULTISPECIES: branched-chain amino acid transport system II carrier protein [Shewanella]QFU21428.1 branched-chain amino acid transport system II carrier protein [Shewanella sp. YLB-09]QPG56718.1 branched-chain amino acid transport system II carrier protein [Shewanella eurypsychrophilus]